MLSWGLAALTLAAVLLAAPILGRHLHAVFSARPQPAWDPWLAPLEQRLLAWSAGADPRHGASSDAAAETPWAYLGPLLRTNLVAGAVAWLLLACQPRWLNPAGFPGLRWDLALHTTLSFLTSTDQQHLVPETSLGTGAQLGAIQFLMFLSAATGLAVGFAVIRGFSGLPLGNPHRDLVRALTRVLIPGSLLLALALLLAGVPMTLAPPLPVSSLAGPDQLLPRGPIALLEAIKLLGENGGGVLAANASHPYENPSLFTDLLETGAMLILPAATIEAFGRFVGDRRQGTCLLVLLVVLLVLGAVPAMAAEQAGDPSLASVLDGPNLQGKELRFGVALTGLWTVVSTATMTGASNGSVEALMPMGALMALINLLLQVVFGALGLGVAQLLVFVLLAVFLAGLMVGRTPLLFGRRLEQPQVKAASFALLLHPVFVLVPAAITLAASPALTGLHEASSHGLTQVLLEYASAAANNGIGLEALGDGGPWWNLTTSVGMLAGRYLPMVVLLVLADGLRQRSAPQRESATQPGSALQGASGILRTDTALFTAFTAVVILVLGALTFLPLLALGPLAEVFTLAAAVP